MIISNCCIILYYCFMSTCTPTAFLFSSHSLLRPFQVLLNKISTANDACCESIKHYIFPDPYIPSSSASTARSSYTGAKAELVTDRGGCGGALTHNNKMDPPAAPPSSVRYMLLKLMTSFDTHLKRSVAELLFVLCEQCVDEFVARTGYGNAVALLQLKGLV